MFASRLHRCSAALALALLLPFALSLVAGAAPEVKTPDALAPAKPAAPPSYTPPPAGPGAGNAVPAKPAEAAPSDGDATSAIRTVDVPVQPVLAVAGKSSWDDGLKTFTTAFAALRGEMERLGLKPGGRPVAIFVDSDDESFRYEVMIPLADAPGKDARPKDGFRFATNPGGKALKFEHRDAYAEIEITYEAITAYLDEKGLEARDFFIEEFVTDPKNPEDPGLQVNIYVFLK